MAGSSPAMTENDDNDRNLFPTRLKLAGRLVLLAAIVAGIVLAWLHRDALSPSAIEASLSHSAWAPALYLLAHIVASLLFIPRTVMGIAAGLLFGFIRCSVMGSVCLLQIPAQMDVQGDGYAHYDQGTDAQNQKPPDHPHSRLG